MGTRGNFFSCFRDKIAEKQRNIFVNPNQETNRIPDKEFYNGCPLTL